MPFPHSRARAGNYPWGSLAQALGRPAELVKLLDGNRLLEALHLPLEKCSPRVLRVTGGLPHSSVHARPNLVARVANPCAAVAPASKQQRRRRVVWAGSCVCPRSEDLGCLPDLDTTFTSDRFNRIVCSCSPGQHHHRAGWIGVSAGKLSHQGDHGCILSKVSNSAHVQHTSKGFQARIARAATRKLLRPREPAIIWRHGFVMRPASGSV